MRMSYYLEFDYEQYLLLLEQMEDNIKKIIVRCRDRLDRPQRRAYRSLLQCMCFLLCSSPIFAIRSNHVLHPLAISHLLYRWFLNSKSLRIDGLPFYPYYSTFIAMFFFCIFLFYIWLKC